MLKPGHGLCHQAFSFASVEFLVLLLQRLFSSGIFGIASVYFAGVICTVRSVQATPETALVNFACLVVRQAL